MSSSHLKYHYPNGYSVENLADKLDEYYSVMFYLPNQMATIIFSKQTLNLDGKDTIEVWYEICNRDVNSQWPQHIIKPKELTKEFIEGDVIKELVVHLKELQSNLNLTLEELGAN